MSTVESRFKCKRSGLIVRQELVRFDRADLKTCGLSLKLGTLWDHSFYEDVTCLDPGAFMPMAKDPRQPLDAQYL